MSKTNLSIELPAAIAAESTRDAVIVRIYAASAYADSMFHLIRMARGLDDVDDPRDAAAFNEAITHACRLGNAMQDCIRREISELESEPAPNGH